MLRLENVRYRLTLWYVCVFGLILLLFIGGATLLQYLQLKQQMYHAEIQDVETVEGLLSFSPSGQLELHEGYHNHPQHRLLLDRYMEVLSPHGDVLFRNSKLGRQSLGAEPVEEEGTSSYSERSVCLDDGTRLLAISHVHSIGNTALLIRLGYSEAPLWQGVREFFGLLLLAVPFALLIAGFAGYRMALNAMRPVEEMASRASTITAHNLSHRLPVENPKDEFGHMASVFNELLRRLEESFDNLKRFTADASHELRTPLASIRSVGEVGLQRPHSSAEYQDIIGSMLEEVTRLTQMVDGLLTMSRADSGMAVLNKTTFSLFTLAQEIVETMSMLAEEKGQQLVLHGNDAVFVTADSMLLQRAIGNVVENAIKYAPAASRIEVRVIQDENWPSILLEIEDQGEPIPEALQEKIFDRFYRMDESRSRDAGGTGLGLAIARWGVSANGGAISVRPGQRQGNCFVIELPRSARNQA